MQTKGEDYINYYLHKEIVVRKCINSLVCHNFFQHTAYFFSLGNKFCVFTWWDRFLPGLCAKSTSIGICSFLGLQLSIRQFILLGKLALTVPFQCRTWRKNNFYFPFRIFISIYAFPLIYHSQLFILTSHFKTEITSKLKMLGY